MTATTITFHEEVLESFNEEIVALLQVYRAVRRQRRHMLQRQVERMAQCIERIDQWLPRAKEANRRREELLLEAGLQPQDGRKGLQAWAEGVDTPVREQLLEVIARLTKIADRLHGLNFQNFQLARFSLDLAQEEIRILVGDPRHDRVYAPEGEAKETQSPGVVDGRA